MNLLSPQILRKDAKGKLRFWQYEVDGDKYRTISGTKGGTPVCTAWTKCTAKSQATNEAQAAFEGQAEMNKKLDREYRRTIEELDSVPASPMLAQDFKKQKTIKFPVYSQPKLDGIRAIVSRHGAFSREYQRHLNVDHILEMLAPFFTNNPDAILDGELYNHGLKADFNKIASVVRKQDPDAEQRAEAKRLIQYHVYDCISPELFLFRDHFLKFELITGDAVRLVQTDLVSSQDELDLFYAQYIEQGYEGQMVRIDAPYEADRRSKTLLKRKEFQTGEFKLLRIEEGQGNWAGYAKRIVFSLPDERECGAGLKGDQTFARNLLQNAEDFIGGDVTIKFFNPTPDGMPRFPVAVDFHPQGRAD